MQRRTLLKPVAGTAKANCDQAQVKTDDPIWGMIEKHRNAATKFSEAVRVEFASEGKVPERQFASLKQTTADASDDLMNAGRSLLTTRPTTLFGVIAVLRYVQSQVDEDDPSDGGFPTYLPEDVDGEFWARAFFGTIADALISI